MANDISITAKLSVNKNGAQLSRSKTFNVAMAGDGRAYNLQTIGTTHEAIEIGGVATVGQCFFYNTDATNFVEIGIVVSGTFYPVLKLKPGEGQVWRAGTNALYAKANTADVKLEALLLDN